MHPSAIALPVPTVALGSSGSGAKESEAVARPSSDEAGTAPGVRETSPLRELSGLVNRASSAGANGSGPHYSDNPDACTRRCPRAAWFSPRKRT